MEKQKIKVEKIIDAHDGITVVEQNDRLDGRVSYWLGRFGDDCLSTARNFNKQRSKILADVQRRQDPLSDLLKTEKDPKKVAELTIEIQKLNLEFQDRVAALLDETEEIAVPNFKIEDFLSKEDTSYKEVVKDEKGEPKTVEIKVKKGQALVPVRFFRLMGSLIKE